MEEKSLTNTCSFFGISPVMVDLPYPDIRVRERNRDYAELLCMDYCGYVSELSATLQYVNHESRISGEKCSVARTLLGIAMSEMVHLQKLGQLIILLGGDVSFFARNRNGCPQLWTPECLTLPAGIDKMLAADIESEKNAIRQYEMHINMIKDDCVNAVLRRIIIDEEYHIMLLKALKNER